MVCAFPVLFVFQELCAGRVPGIVRMFNSCRSTCINQAVSVTSALPLPLPLAAWSWWHGRKCGRAGQFDLRLFLQSNGLRGFTVGLPACHSCQSWSATWCLLWHVCAAPNHFFKVCTLVLSSYSKVELFDFSFLSLKGCIGCRVHILKESVVWDFVAVIIQGARIKPAKSFHPKKSSLQFRLIGLV